MSKKLEDSNISDGDLQKLLDAPLWIGVPRAVNEADNTLPSPAKSNGLSFGRFYGENKSVAERKIENVVDSEDLK